MPSQRRIALKRLTAAAVGVLLATASFSHSALAQRVKVTLNGVYRDVGAAPAPQSNFSLVFEIARSPLVCGGGAGSFIACSPSQPEYTDGPLDVILSQGADATILFRDASAGGGFQLFQQDLGLNRLSFIIGSNVLFGGGLASPILMDGVYAITPNAYCAGWWEGCTYNSFAGQGFAVGDPVNNPFIDYLTLQSYDPLTSGTITIAAVDAVDSTPEPSAAWLLMTGLMALCAVAARRRALRIGAPA